MFTRAISPFMIWLIDINLSANSKRQRMEKNYRILILEDTDSDYELLIYALEKTGISFQIKRAYDCPEFETGLSDFQPHIILSDYWLPQYTGYEALLYAKEHAPDTPFILVTGSINEETAVKCMLAGATDYVTKEHLSRLEPSIIHALEHAQKHKILKHRDTIIRAVNKITHLFISQQGNWNEYLNQVLKLLGESVNVSRAYLFRNHVGNDGSFLSTQEAEWVAPGIEPQIDNPDLQNLCLEDSGFSRWVKQMEKGRAIIGVVRDFPEDEKEFLRLQDIKSIICVPIYLENHWWGFIGFDDCKNERNWDEGEINAIQLAADTLGLVIKRYESQQELQESEERYRSTITSMKDLIFQIDREGCFRDFYAKNEKELFLPPEEFLGKKFIEVLPDEIAQNLQIAKNRIADGKTSEEFIYSMSSNGEVNWYSATITGRFDSDGQFAGLTCVIRNITEQRNAESQIHELARFVEQNPNPVLQVNQTGKILYANPVALELLEKVPRDIPDEIPAEWCNYKALKSDHSSVCEVDVEGLIYEFELVPMGRDDLIYLYGKDVTGRHEAIRLVKEQNKFLENVLEAISHPFYVIDVSDCKIIQANSATYKYGNPENSTCYALTHKLDHSCKSEGWPCPMEIIKKTGKPALVEHVHYSSDGEVRYYEVYGFPIFNEDGEMIQMIEYNIDITDRRKMQIQLQENEEKYRTVVENATDIIFQTNLEGQIIFFNKVAEKITGYPENQLKNMSFRTIVHPKDVDWVFDLFNKQYHSAEAIHQYECRIITKDKKTVWLGIRSRKLLEGGKIVGWQSIARDITIRKRAQEELKESEGRYRTLVEASPNAIFIHQDGKIVYVNNAAIKLSGAKNKEEILGRRAMDHVHPDFQVQIIERVKYMMETGNATPPQEEKLLKLDGTVLDVRATAIPMIWEKRPAIQAIIQDITEEKRSRAQQHAVYKISEAVHCTRNLDELYKEIHSIISGIMRVENLYIALYYSESNTISFPYFLDQKEISPPERKRLSKSLIEYVISKKKTSFLKSDEINKLVEEGKVRLSGTLPLEWIGVPLQLETGIIGAIVVQNYEPPEVYSERDVEILQFVSNQIAIAIQRKKHEEELVKFKTISDKASYGTAIITPDGKMDYLNKYYAEVHGYTIEEMLKQTCVMVYPERFIDDARKIHEELSEKGYFVAKEVWHKHKDGHEFPMLMSGIAVNDESDQVKFIAITAIDISELKEKEKELRVALKKAKESEKVKYAFISNISHEIRTPLNAIIGFTDLISVTLHSDESELIHEFIDSVHQSSIRLIETVDAILNISLLESDAYEGEMQNFSLNDVIYEIIDEVIRYKEGKPVELSVNMPTKAIKFHGDRVSIKTALSNIIKNAFIYTGKGSIDIWLKRMVRGGSKLIVQDTGIGISPAYLKRVFEPFSQESEGVGRAYEGVGLGLPLAKRFLEYNNARIDIKSKKKQGTKVIITFPPNKLKENT